MTSTAALSSSPLVRRLGARGSIAGIVAVWVVGWFFLRGRNTLELAQADTTPLHDRLTELYDSVGASRNENPFFVYFINYIRLFIDSLVNFFFSLVSQPFGDRGAPLLGWLGVVALVAFVSWVFAGWKYGLLAGAGFAFLGLQGLWIESMDTFALTTAAVLIALLIGIPLGVWAGLSDRVNNAITPILDFMQMIPTFCYLAPLTLFFLIGPASATIATLIYALPPVIRITAHGIRSVPGTTLEATESLGATTWQTLTQVMLPMAKRTIVLGTNQTIMAALSMATIAALIDAPGLGKVVIKALSVLDVGGAFNAGLAIVILAIVLDRVTTAASTRVTGVPPTGRALQLRRLTVAAGGLVTLICVYLSATFVWASEFPDTINVGPAIRSGSESVTTWVQETFAGLTTGFKDVVTSYLLDPLQALLSESPWWLSFAGLVCLAAVLGGRRAVTTTAVCLALIIGSGLWNDSMVTLAATLIGAIIVMVFGVVFGVWMGRSRRADQVIRPILDAGQTMPAFVYLVPFLALFGTSRFTGIAAAVVYAAPAAIKIIADGVRGLSATTMEAAASTGATTWQTIRLVQLPMSAKSLALGANQGIIYVLSMVVVGGLVGGGALGYLVAAGLVQGQLYGKGLAAGIAIALLGIMLDRISQHAAQRVDPSRPR